MIWLRGSTVWWEILSFEVRKTRVQIQEPSVPSCLTLSKQLILTLQTTTPNQATWVLPSTHAIISTPAVQCVSLLPPGKLLIPSHFWIFSILQASTQVHPLAFSKYLLSTYCVPFLDQVLQAWIYIWQMLASKNSQSDRRGRQETKELVVLKQLLLLHERRKGQSGGFKGAQPSSFLFSLSLSTSFNADTLTNKI